MALCGGSARIPRLQQLIQEMFPEVELLSSAPPDEVIAVGAALEAGLLVGRDGLGPEEESVAVDVSAADILLKVNESELKHVLQMNLLVKPKALVDVQEIMLESMIEGSFRIISQGSAAEKPHITVRTWNRTSVPSSSFRSLQSSVNTVS